MRKCSKDNHYPSRESESTYTTVAVEVCLGSRVRE